MKRTLIILLGIITSLGIILILLNVALTYLLGGGEFMQNDQRMISYFKKNRSDFEIFVIPNEDDVTIKLIPEAVNRRKDGSVYITTYAFGLATGGREKGYAYIPNPPQNIVSSIDDSKISAVSNIPIHRHITDNWYLYYVWDD